MSFYYKLQPVTDNINTENKKKGLMAMAISLGNINLDSLAREISGKTTYSRSEVKGILDAMVDETERFLTLGYNVTLGELGTFSVSANGRIVDTPDDIRGNSISLKRIIHRPSRAMKKRLDSETWERVAWDKKPAHDARKKGVANEE